jgi:uncharacterized damage-inducible protein DinB
MDPEQAFEKMEESRQELFATITELSRAEMCNTQVEGEWTIRDILAHLAAWDQISLEAMRAYLAPDGVRVPIITDHDGWNAEQTATRKSSPLEEVLKELARVRLELLAIMDGLSEQQWEQVHTLPWGAKGTPADLLSGLAWHEMEHIKAIRKWKGQQV